MPYKTIGELPDNLDALPTHAKEIYMAAFNSAWEQHKGEEGAEARSHAIAWGAVKRSYKQVDDKWVAKEAGVVKTDLQSLYSEFIHEYGKRNIAADAGRINKVMEQLQGLLDDEIIDSEKAKVTITEATKVLEWLKLQEVMKTDDGVEYPASAYAYVPDEDKPSEWKLRLWEDPEKKVTRVQLGKAAAALSPGGFRGQRVEIPRDDLSAVKRKIRAEYRKLDVEDEDIPRWVKESESRFLFETYVPLSEAQLTNKGIARIVVIQPGWGNSVDNHFYSEDMLRQSYKMFDGVKMYADHQTDAQEKERPEGSIKEWVASLKNVQYQEGIGVIGDAIVIEPWMQAKLANLRDKGLLNEMGISIRAAGVGVKGKVDGRDGNIIEKISRVKSVDFVTEPGAGGMVTFYESNSSENDIDVINLETLRERRPDLVKSIEDEVKTNTLKEAKKAMELEERIKELETANQGLIQERDALKAEKEHAEKAQRIAEAKSLVDDAISKSELPDAAKNRLLEKFNGTESADGIDDAIKNEKSYIQALSESGKVKKMGSTQPDPDKSAKEMEKIFREVHPDWTEQQIAIAAKGR